MNGPQISWLPDGRRLHMNHGPIDLIVQAWGAEDEVRAAYEQAADRFQTVLTELVAELPELRKQAPSSGRLAATFSPRGEEEAQAYAIPSPLWGPKDGRDRWLAPGRSAERSGGGVRGRTAPTLDPLNVHGPTARRMTRAVAPFAEMFITPMAAVAGSVADEMLAAMLAGRTLARAYVNDGGDIALHIAQGNALKLSIAGTGNGFADRIEIAHQHPVRGVATSGWRGRSHSLGIADAVTVLAKDAATADTAATLIANAVDLPGHPAITRAPANSLQPDSDLGGRLVTTGVGHLSAGDIATALALGLDHAENYRRRGLIEAAILFLGGQPGVTGFSTGTNQENLWKEGRFRGSQIIPLSYLAIATSAGCRNILETVS